MVLSKVIGPSLFETSISMIASGPAAVSATSEHSLATEKESFRGHDHHSDTEDRSFIAVKPDGVARGLIGEIISRFEHKGLRLVAIKILHPSEQLARDHYKVHEGKSFFKRLIHFFTSGPIVAMVWEGPRAITVLRKLVGETHPEDAVPGSIRGDFAFQRGHNLVHSSDSIESAEREIKVWFTEDELILSKL